MEKKRYFLLILLSFGLLVIEEVRDMVYIPVIFVVNSLVIFVNYPCVILISNRRPFYIEDLFISDRNEISITIGEEVKKRYEKRLNNILIISNVLFVGALSDYWYYEFSRSASESKGDTLVEMIGITGGIIKMFQLLNHSSCSMLLYLTRRSLESSSE